jgi:tRNA G26 N,N-dimethylase Trm1
MVTKEHNKSDLCSICGKSLKVAGQLWISKLFNKTLVKKMETFNLKKIDYNTEDNAIGDTSMLSTCLEENDDIPYYFVTDEIAAKLKTSPYSVEQAIERLSGYGYRASKTILNTRGFKTDAKIKDILDILRQE